MNNAILTVTQAEQLAARFDVFPNNRFARECARILRTNLSAMAHRADVLSDFTDLAERLESDSA